jgi:hypothetical protein
MSVLAPSKEQKTESKVHYTEYIRSEDKPAEESKPVEESKPAEESKPSETTS